MLAGSRPLTSREAFVWWSLLVAIAAVLFATEVLSKAASPAVAA